MTIGGGTAILKHLSLLVNPTIAALKQSTCATANYSLPGAADGDTIASAFQTRGCWVAGYSTISLGSARLTRLLFAPATSIRTISKQRQERVRFVSTSGSTSDFYRNEMKLKSEISASLCRLDSNWEVRNGYSGKV